MADVGYLAMVAAGLGAYWWRHLRIARSRVAFHDALAPDADVALHVAIHEAHSRREPLASLHVLYGLLQDEAMTGAITASGGDPAALEHRVLDALDGRDRRGADDPVVWRLEAILGQVRANGRRATCADLFIALAGLPAAGVCEAAELDGAGVMYALVHGGRPPEIAGDGPDVLVILRNDHYTTQEFVLRLLTEVFALPGEEARTRMWQAHREGRAVLGRFTAADARARITDARGRARRHAYPLWLGTEPT